MDKGVNCVLVTTAAADGTTTTTSPSSCSITKHGRGGGRGSKNLLIITTSICALVAVGVAVLLAIQLHGHKKICLTASCVRTAASLLEAINTSTNPCDDFFLFACGNWNKRHLIPEDRASISRFEVLSDQIQLILKELLEEPRGELDSDATLKAKDFYVSCMNLSRIREVGLHPIISFLDSIGGWPVVSGANWSPKLSVETLIGRISYELDMGFLTYIWISPDDKNSSNNIIQVDQMQLGLPSRDYFLNESKELRAYHLYMTDLSTLFNASFHVAFEEFKEVLDFEIALANVSIPEVDRQDTSAIYRKFSLASLQREIPEFNWTEYLQAFLQTEPDPDEPIVSYAFPYLKDMAVILKKTPPRVVQNYVVWRVLMDLTIYLVDKFQEAKIEFRQVLMGVTLERIRWQQCVEWTNKKLGMAVGALFIRDNFDPSAKETAQEMIGNIREAFIELLDHIHWMDGETRLVAKEKAVRMNERIGYPDYLTVPHELNKEYSDLNVSRSEFLGNVIGMGRWRAEQAIALLRKPVDKERWTTEPPAVVNAFYDPNKNNIVFPAGILQPSFYSQDFPKSLNYGGIGVVIGHEITHGFDDKGRQYDKDGNMKEWWNNETIKEFREQTQCIVDQYSSYRIDAHIINGRMTQGENIADNGGLKQAYRAFKKWEKAHGPEPLLPGLEWMTHDQYFFLNYAQIWCGSMRPEDLLSKIRSAVHSPAPIRVLGPLSNSIDFSQAFSCPLGAPMNPVVKCSVW